MKTELSTIERVEFHGDTIEVARIGDKGYAHLKPMCEALPIDYPSQLKKLRGVPWGGVVIITTPDERGCRQRLAMIDLDAVPMWLATIHPSKVAFAARIKLEAYQLEAAKVLAAWFNGPEHERIARMANLDRDLIALRNDIAKLTTQNENAAVFMQYERRKRLESDAKLVDIAQTLDTVMKPFQAHGGDYLTVRDFCLKYHVLDSTGRSVSARHFSAIGKRLTGMSRHARVLVHKVQDLTFGYINTYRLDILNAWRTDYDFRNIVPSEAYAKFHQPRLFG